MSAAWLYGFAVAWTVGSLSVGNNNEGRASMTCAIIATICGVGAAIVSAIDRLTAKERERG